MPPRIEIEAAPVAAEAAEPEVIGKGKEAAEEGEGEGEKEGAKETAKEGKAERAEKK